MNTLFKKVTDYLIGDDEEEKETDMSDVVVDTPAAIVATAEPVVVDAPVAPAAVVAPAAPTVDGDVLISSLRAGLLAFGYDIPEYDHLAAAALTKATA